MSGGGREDAGPAGRGGLLLRVWRSIVRGPLYPRDDRDRKWIVVNNLILHLRPVRVPARAIRYTHTFGLGGMSLVLFLLLAGTGVLLQLAYEPSPAAAHGSILALQNDMLFGRLTRSVHHWSANLLVAVVLLHLARVYLTGAYHPPRQFNWVIGLALLCGVLAQNFTGYLLPWDQLSYWATTIVTGMLGYVPVAGGWLRGVIRGGDEIGSAALINFYTFHTTILPLLVVLLMAWHFWRVRKARGVVVPRAPGEARDESPEQVLTLPSLLLREFVVALVLVACVLVFSMFVAAPLGDAANPGMSPNPAKAPWYFVGFQELLLHFHPFFAVVVLPILAGLALLLVPYLPYEKDSSGIFMISRRGRKLGIIAAGAALVVTTLWVVLDEVWIDFGAWLPFLPASIGEGLLPVALLLALLVGFYLLLRGRLAGSRDEAVQSMFLFLTAAFLVLTLTGVWFRGEGMALVWPWDL